jgi:hypothetical protein
MSWFAALVAHQFSLSVFLPNLLLPWLSVCLVPTVHFKVPWDTAPSAAFDVSSFRSIHGAADAWCRLFLSFWVECRATTSIPGISVERKSIGRDVGVHQVIRRSGHIRSSMGSTRECIQRPVGRGESPHQATTTHTEKRPGSLHTGIQHAGGTCSTSGRPRPEGQAAILRAGTTS